MSVYYYTTDVYCISTHSTLLNEFCKGQYSRKRVQPLKKRKKSCFLDFQKKFLKTLKKRSHLVMQPLIARLPEVGTGKSRSPTSNILLRSVDTNYATENCV